MRAIALTKPGVPGNKVIAEVYRSQILGIDSKYGDYAGCFPLRSARGRTRRI